VKRSLVVLAVFSLVLAGCAGDEEEGGGGGGGAAAPPVSLQGTTNDHGTKAASGSMEVELDDFYFGPTFITATPGQQITLELHNEGEAPHTFTSTELGNIDEELAPGARRTVRITAPASGMALITCRFHRAQGMQGALVVR
jgi:plastocyanin